MKSIEDISNELNNLDFVSYSKYIAEFLNIFSISNTTVRRIIEKAAKEQFREVIYVYKRAIILCVSDKNISSITEGYIGITPLIISISPQFISVKSNNYGEVCCRHNEIGKHVLIFSHLLENKRKDKDIYETLDFASLIFQLKNKIKSLKPNIQITDLIVNVVYLVLSCQLINKNETKQVLNWSSRTNNFDDILIDLCKINRINNANFIDVKLFHDIPIDRQLFSIINNLFNYDISLIDSEVLSSLLYKLLDNSTDINLIGHQTSYQNINKLLTPLLIEKYNNIINKKQQINLHEVVLELKALKFFDPTNGPGCFLASAMNAVVNLINDINKITGSDYSTELNTDNYIALVSNDVSYKLSKLIIWFTYIQNSITDKISINYIVEIFDKIKVSVGNQLTSDWSLFCKNDGNVYIIGSPLFKGANKQTEAMKEDIEYVCGVKVNNVDYASAWLIKASDYIKYSKSKAAFILTNSICQGEQVMPIWSNIHSKNCEIEFAYRPFKWYNTSSDKVGVTVIIIGITDKRYAESKILIDAETRLKCTYISPYLIPNINTYIVRRKHILSKHLPKMRKGNMPYDNGALMFNWNNKNEFLSNIPNSKTIIKRLVGAEEYINGVPRYCFWIRDDQSNWAKTIDIISDRIGQVKLYRETSKASKKTKNNPHQFREFIETQKGSQTLIVPSVSSENRVYIPIGFVYDNTIINNLAFAIYDCETWVLPILVSKMHQLWIKIVCGKLESRNRYSSELGYNTFPFPEIDNLQKHALTQLSRELIKTREEYCELSLGELYSNTPPKLANIHQKIDEYIDECYGKSVFNSDTERLSMLFNLYLKMIEDEK